MTTKGDCDRHDRALPSQGGRRWRAIFLGILGLGLFAIFASRDHGRPRSDELGSSVAQRTSATEPPTGGARTLASAGLQVVDAVPGQRAATMQGGHFVAEPLGSPLENATAVTPDATNLKRWLQDARERGVGAVPAIRDFLRLRQDVHFEKTRDGKPAEPRTLRLALIDLLRQIGGPEAMEASLEQLRITESPGEIAMLAINLEAAAPGVYRDEAMWTVVNALQALARTKEPFEVLPLFEALRVLGGPEAMATLEQLAHNADTVRYLRNKDTYISPTVGTYALVTLAGMPDGNGVFRLAELAGDPNVPVAHKTVGPFQMLAQASAGNAQAGEELVALALEGQVPDRAWDAVANALAGKHLLFPTPAAAGAPTGKNESNGTGAGARFVRGFYDDERNVLYEERLVSRSWSAPQVQRQLALIDALLTATDSPAATQALLRAQETLRRRR